jgi:hypothetical protein
VRARSLTIKDARVDQITRVMASTESRTHSAVEDMNHTMAGWKDQNKKKKKLPVLNTLDPDNHRNEITVRAVKAEDWLYRDAVPAVK